jgi:hypothetical protein
MERAGLRGPALPKTFRSLMFDVSMISESGYMLHADNVTYRLVTDEKHPLLILEGETGTTFYNWNNLLSFGASPVDA